MVFVASISVADVVTSTLDVVATEWEAVAAMTSDRVSVVAVPNEERPQCLWQYKKLGVCMLPGDCCNHGQPPVLINVVYWAAIYSRISPLDIPALMTVLPMVSIFSCIPSQTWRFQRYQSERIYIIVVYQ